MDALFVAGLASGLAFVGEKILDKIADVGLGPIDETEPAGKGYEFHGRYFSRRPVISLRTA